MKKIMLSSLLTLTMMVSVLLPTSFAVEYGTDIPPGQAEYTQKFSGVPQSHWAFQYIAEMVNRGAVSGYPDGLFRPGKTVTRAEFAKIMLGAAGKTPVASSVSSYADVPLTNWASPFVETAKPYMTAYRNGNTLLFKPSAGALREDIAVAVVKLKGYDTRIADLSMLESMFTDTDSISSSAKPYVALAVENGLISGYPDGTFRGQGTITRGEAAAVLWRAFQYGSDDKVIPGDEGENPNSGMPEKPELPEAPSVEPKPDPEPEIPVMPTEPDDMDDFTHIMDTVA